MWKRICGIGWKKLTRTQEFDLYAFSEESLEEELNTENKEAEHVKDLDT